MLSSEDIKKYNKLDNCLKLINKNYITPNKNMRESYHNALLEVLKEVRYNMAEVDSMFRNCQGTNHYAGSVCDNVKVGKLDEFDMNIAIKLPEWTYQDDIVITNGNPGFIKINVKKGWDRCSVNDNFEQKYKEIKNWMDNEGFLIQDKFHSWMESVITRALNKFQRINGFYNVIVNSGTYLVKHKKSGPSHCLDICKEYNSNFKFSVDLVAVFEFNTRPDQFIWPEPPVRRQPSNCSMTVWCAVPKPMNNTIGNREWRICFFQQEKELMYAKERLKDVIRQLKKLRSCYKETSSLTSYYIKTMILWEVEENSEIWSLYSSGALFMLMLKKLYERIRDRRIDFYWDTRCNLLDAHETSLPHMQWRLERIIDTIEENLPGNPEILVDLILTEDEQIDFRDKYTSSPSTSSFEHSFRGLQISERNMGQQQQSNNSWMYTLAGVGAAAAVGAGLIYAFNQNRRNNQ